MITSTHQRRITLSTRSERSAGRNSSEGMHHHRGWGRERWEWGSSSKEEEKKGVLHNGTWRCRASQRTRGGATDPNTARDTSQWPLCNTTPTPKTWKSFVIAIRGVDGFGKSMAAQSSTLDYFSLMIAKFMIHGNGLETGAILGLTNKRKRKMSVKVLNWVISQWNGGSSNGSITQVELCYQTKMRRKFSLKTYRNNLQLDDEHRKPRKGRNLMIEGNAEQRTNGGYATADAERMRGLAERQNGARSPRAGSKTRSARFQDQC